ncbi:hypothetical protein ELJ01_27925, partial [Klebsiella pneumoniae]|nr:hypothetical protein [Klebsiella pneumoniae]
MSVFQHCDSIGLRHRKLHPVPCCHIERKHLRVGTVAKLAMRQPFVGTVAKLAMRQPFVLFKGLTFQKLCL